MRITIIQKLNPGLRSGLAAYLLLSVANVVSGILGLMLALPRGYASPIFASERKKMDGN